MRAQKSLQTLISSSQNFKLEGSVENESLKLRLEFFRDFAYTQIYEAQIMSLGFFTLLEQHFTDINNVLQYILQPEHITLNLEQFYLEITAKISVQKNNILRLAKIPFSLLQIIQSDYIQQIPIRCNKNEELTNQEIKNYLKRIALNLNQIIRQKNQQQKFQNADQSRFVTKQELKIEIQNLKRLLQEQRQRQNFSSQKHKIQYSIQKEVIIEGIKQKRSQFEEQVKKQITKSTEKNRKQITDLKIKVLQVESLKDLYTQMELKVNEEIASIKSAIQQKFREKGSILEQVQIHQKRVQNVIEEISAIKNAFQLGDYPMNMPALIKNVSSLDSSPSIPSSSGTDIKKITALQWVDQQCKDYKFLILKSNKIIARQSAYVFGKSKLHGVCCFTVVIDKMQKWIGLGAIGTQYRKVADLSDAVNRVTYFSDCQCRVGPQCKANQGLGFHNGETVKVQIDLVQGKIQWIVNGQVRHQLNYNLLKDGQVQWKPFVVLWDKDDSVRLINEEEI